MDNFSNQNIIINQDKVDNIILFIPKDSVPHAASVFGFFSMGADANEKATIFEEKNYENPKEALIKLLNEKIAYNNSTLLLICTTHEVDAEQKATMGNALVKVGYNEDWSQPSEKVLSDFMRHTPFIENIPTPHLDLPKCDKPYQAMIFSIDKDIFLENNGNAKIIGYKFCKKYSSRLYKALLTTTNKEATIDLHEYENHEVLKMYKFPHSFLEKYAKTPLQIMNNTNLKQFTPKNRQHLGYIIISADRSIINEVKENLPRINELKKQIKTLENRELSHWESVTKQFLSDKLKNIEYPEYFYRRYQGEVISKNLLREGFNFFPVYAGIQDEQGEIIGDYEPYFVVQNIGNYTERDFIELELWCRYWCSVFDLGYLVVQEPKQGKSYRMDRDGKTKELENEIMDQIHNYLQNYRKATKEEENNDTPYTHNGIHFYLNPPLISVFKD